MAALGLCPALLSCKNRQSAPRSSPHQETFLSGIWHQALPFIFIVKPNILTVKPNCLL